MPTPANMMPILLPQIDWKKVTDCPRVCGSQLSRANWVWFLKVGNLGGTAYAAHNG